MKKTKHPNKCDVWILKKNEQRERLFEGTVDFHKKEK